MKQSQKNFKEHSFGVGLGRPTKTGFHYFSRVPAFMLSIMASFFVYTTPAIANPTGGVVVSGGATISTQGSNTTITQSSNQAIINWTSFNIGAKEKTQFIQPNAQSIALNRINPNQGVSQIFGNSHRMGELSWSIRREYFLVLDHRWMSRVLLHRRRASVIKIFLQANIFLTDPLPTVGLSSIKEPSRHRIMDWLH
jgi:hypothetical protein